MNIQGFGIQSSLQLESCYSGTPTIHLRISTGGLRLQGLQKMLKSSGSEKGFRVWAYNKGEDFAMGALDSLIYPANIL